jgi:hypothetical protein
MVLQKSGGVFISSLSGPQPAAADSNHTTRCIESSFPYSATMNCGHSVLEVKLLLELSPYTAVPISKRLLVYPFAKRFNTQKKASMRRNLL